MATLPGYGAGRRPASKGRKYQPDPPRPEEVNQRLDYTSRPTGPNENRHGAMSRERFHAFCVTAWRTVRISELLDLEERDLNHRDMSIAVRNGKGNKFRLIGPDEWGWDVLNEWITASPVAGARRSRQARKQIPYLVKPAAVELMRAHLLRHREPRDVVLLELLAYASLRPESEAITLPWRHVRERSLLIVDTKRGKERTIPLVEQLRVSLEQWRGLRPGPLVVPALWRLAGGLPARLRRRVRRLRPRCAPPGGADHRGRTPDREPRSG